MLRFITGLLKTNEGKVSGKSEKGLKNIQEDSYLISTVVNGRRLIIVADGVGGHGHGDFASSLCVNTFKEEFLNLDREFSPEDFLEKTSILVAEKILEKSKGDESYKNCGTTVSGFLIVKDKYYTLNIGDSRVYLFRAGLLKQITEDHSMVKRLVKEGKITEEESKIHPKRHIMTSALGQPLEIMTISIEGPQKWNRGDVIIACTDGVHEFLSEKDLSHCLKETNPEVFAERIVDYALKAGSNDNITCCCIKF